MVTPRPSSVRLAASAAEMISPTKVAMNSFVSSFVVVKWPSPTGTVHWPVVSLDMNGDFRTYSLEMGAVGTEGVEKGNSEC